MAVFKAGWSLLSLDLNHRPLFFVKIYMHPKYQVFNFNYVCITESSTHSLWTNNVLIKGDIFLRKRVRVNGAVAEV